MKKFSGFPDGKLTVTPLPNLFFSELLAAIEDLAELKVTLHIFWLIAQGKHRAQNVTRDELRGDATLMQSLAACEGKPAETLTRGLDAAVERGSLLQKDDAYFLNTESGRRASEKFESASKQVRAEQANVAERPNIFVLYEKNIGMLTPMISEELKEAEEQYPAEWIAEAFKEAVTRNARNWKYVNAILKRWKAEGRQDDPKKRKRWWGDEYDKYVNR